MVMQGVMRKATIGAAVAALACGAAGAQQGPQRFEARRGGVVIEVSLSNRPVAMRSLTNRDWQSKTAPVIVHILRAGLPPVTMWATPAYGDVDLPGRHVHVTYLTRYRAQGDRTDAEPLHDGIPIEPDARKRDGKTPMDVPLMSVARLEVVLDVSNGQATTSLRNAADPAKNIVFAR